MKTLDFTNPIDITVLAFKHCYSTEEGDHLDYYYHYDEESREKVASQIIRTDDDNLFVTEYLIENVKDYDSFMKALEEIRYSHEHPTEADIECEKKLIELKVLKEYEEHKNLLDAIFGPQSLKKIKRARKYNEERAAELETELSKMKIYAIEHEATAEPYNLPDRYYSLSLSEINEIKDDLVKEWPDDKIEIEEFTFNELKSILTICELEDLLNVKLFINDEKELQIKKE